MDTATKVNIVLSILSFILALISIITVVITLRQNHTMIENATRPYLCIYGQSINPGSPEFYLVIKNFGASPATVTKFEYDPDLSNCYGFSPCRDFLSDIARCTFAPGQSRICRLDYSSVPESITFKLEYHSGKQTYSDTFTTDIKSGADMLTTKLSTADKELRTISYVLQEILQKNL